MRLWRYLGLLAGVTVSGLVGLSALQSLLPLSQDQITERSARLFHYGSIRFVHGQYQGPRQALFDCVAAGKTLSPEQSATYRRIYQQELLALQSTFTRLDEDLQLRRDADMDQPNNIGGHGIAGYHDHHDRSAQANLTEMERNLVDLRTARGIARITLANDIYKDLLDLMVHLAPAVHSVGPIPSADQLVAPESDAAVFMHALRSARTAPVGSTAYHDHIRVGLEAYARLVTRVQSEVRQINGPMLHLISGQWLSFQTVAPVLRADDVIPRLASPTPCLL